ncbi:hypothetical protein BH09MYX1_BH09MYX1_21940 [soil metagenome]
MRALRISATLFAFGGATVVACAVYDSSLLLTTSSSSGDAGTIDAEAGSATCAGERPPDRPAVDDPTSDPDLDVLVAVREIDLGLDAGTRNSFNLDGKCTCPESESCKPRSDAPKHCDDDAGRDNSASALLAKFAILGSELNPSNVNERVAAGLTGLLIRIKRYNGTLNDRSVEISIYTSNGTKPTSDAGDAGQPLPTHDGKDMWIAAASALQGGSGPPYVSKYVDQSAYVANGVLVALLDFPLTLTGSFAAAFLQLRGTYVSAKLEKDSRGWVLHGGRMAGRWDTRNLLSAMQVIEDPLNKGSYLCGTNVTYQTFKKEICKSADIASNPQNDGLTDVGCDAISLGIGFDTDPAFLDGWEDDTKDAKAPCGPGYTDSCE